MDTLQAQLETALFQRTNPALFYIDLDGFKDVNDGFGHKIGDAVLAEIAKRLNSLKHFIGDEVCEEASSDGQDNLKHSNNLLCRWGGDEFLVLSKFET
jgi:GGDEF domain-containing protein